MTIIIAVAASGLMPTSATLPVNVKPGISIGLNQSAPQVEAYRTHLRLLFGDIQAIFFTK